LAMPGGIGTGALSISSRHALEAMPWLRAIQRPPTNAAPLFHGLRLFHDRR